MNSNFSYGYSQGSKYQNQAIASYSNNSSYSKIKSDSNNFDLKRYKKYSYKTTDDYEKEILEIKKYLIKNQYIEDMELPLKNSIIQAINNINEQNSELNKHHQEQYDNIKQEITETKEYLIQKYLGKDPNLPLKETVDQVILLLLKRNTNLEKKYKKLEQQIKIQNPQKTESETTKREQELEQVNAKLLQEIDNLKKSNADLTQNYSSLVKAYKKLKETNHNNYVLIGKMKDIIIERGNLQEERKKLGKKLGGELMTNLAFDKKEKEINELKEEINKLKENNKNENSQINKEQEQENLKQKLIELTKNQDESKRIISSKDEKIEFLNKQIGEILQNNSNNQSPSLNETNSFNQKIILEEAADKFSERIQSLWKQKNEDELKSIQKENENLKNLFKQIKIIKQELISTNITDYDYYNNNDSDNENENENEASIMIIQKSLHEKDNIIKTLTNEIKNIKSLSNEKDNQNCKLSEEIQKIQSENQLIQSLSNEKDKQNRELKEEIQKIKSENQVIQSLSDEKDNQNRKLSEEIQKIQSDNQLIQSLSNEKDKQNRELKEEIQKIKSENQKNISDQINDIKRLLLSKLNGESSNERTIPIDNQNEKQVFDDHKNHSQHPIEENNFENNNENISLLEKDSKIDDVNHSNNDQINSEKDDEISNLKEKVSKLNNELSETKNQKIGLEDEIGRLNKKLNLEISKKQSAEDMLRRHIFVIQTENDKQLERLKYLHEKEIEAILNNKSKNKKKK